MSAVQVQVWTCASKIPEHHCNNSNNDGTEKQNNKWTQLIEIFDLFVFGVELRVVDVLQFVL